MQFGTLGHITNSLVDKLATDLKNNLSKKSQCWRRSSQWQPDQTPGSKSWWSATNSRLTSMTASATVDVFRGTVKIMTCITIYTHALLLNDTGLIVTI